MKTLELTDAELEVIYGALANIGEVGYDAWVEDVAENTNKARKRLTKAIDTLYEKLAELE